MKNLVLKAGGVAFLGAALVGSVLHVGGNSAQARPAYSKAFLAKYPSLTAAAEAVKKCGVCHGAESKKVRNDYGKAFGKNLPDPKKDIKDTEAINAALAKAEDEKSPSGKTYGEIIKDGKLPASP
ncbi:MAG TPA: hypothetical protein VHZ24_08155 [Pirellulales bacterium]|jgi:cytochrome c553|nr:hypothetical protein [Pirellulales bacterium]